MMETGERRKMLLRENNCHNHINKQNNSIQKLTIQNTILKRFPKCPVSARALSLLCRFNVLKYTVSIP